MKKFNSQAEAHSDRRGSPLASASGTYFFLFLNRLQAQAHRDPGSSPRGSRKDLFFYFLFLDYKHKRAPWHSSSGPGESHAQFY
jgi:hypothetical protein